MPLQNWRWHVTLPNNKEDTVDLHLALNGKETVWVNEKEVTSSFSMQFKKVHEFNLSDGSQAKIIVLADWRKLFLLPHCEIITIHPSRLSKTIVESKSRSDFKKHSFKTNIVFFIGIALLSAGVQIPDTTIRIILCALGGAIIGGAGAKLGYNAVTGSTNAKLPLTADLVEKKTVWLWEVAASEHNLAMLDFWIAKKSIKNFRSKEYLAAVFSKKAGLYYSNESSE